MVRVEFTPEAKRQLEDVPLTIRLRCYEVIERLKRWPEVSGAKPLRGELKGCFRIRTGGLTGGISAERFGDMDYVHQQPQGRLREVSHDDSNTKDR